MEARVVGSGDPCQVFLIEGDFLPVARREGPCAHDFNVREHVLIPHCKSATFAVEVIVMATIVFDTHSYVKRLKAVGFTEEQAEVQSETLAGLINDQLVTKNHLDLRLKELETSLRHEMKEMESRLIIKLGAMIAASIAVVATLVKLL